MSDGTFYIELIEGPEKGTAFRLTAGAVTIGRSKDCDISLDSVKGVSRKHCRLFIVDDKLRIQDLGSQNGTVVEGKKIKEAVINPGVRFKVGQAHFKVGVEHATNAVQKGSDQLASPRSIAASPDNLPGIDADGYDGGGVELAHSAMNAAGKNSKSAFMNFLVLIVFVFLVLYIMQILSKSNPPPEHFAMVKAHEKKALDFDCDFAKVEVEGKSHSGIKVIRIREYNGLLKDSLKRLANNPVALKRPMVIVEGQAEGDGWVILFNKSGRKIGRYRILCRGQDPFYISDNTDPAEALSLGDRAASEAKIFQSDNIEYDAWKHYMLAMRYYALANAPDKESDAFSEGSLLKIELSRKLSAIFNNAMSKAFPQNTKASPVDYPEAIKLLEEAKKLIPDEGSVDRQVIENWQLEIAKLKRTKK